MNSLVKNFQNHFQTLVEIVAQLRGPKGCPWDKEQTQTSLTQYVIEEAFELAEALESQDQNHIQEELGDYLFQVVLQAQVAQDEKHFDLGQVIEKLNHKLIHRHPHVFSNVQVKDAQEVWQNWHKLKNSESETKKTTLFNYPKNLPSLLAALKIGKKTEGFQFDWASVSEVLQKLEEEKSELEQAIETKNREEMIHEVGDLLFCVAQVARHLQLDPEACLRQANARFALRFNKVLELHGGTREEFSRLSPAEKENLWAKAKDLLKKT